jgi:hypothetical protein
VAAKKSEWYKTVPIFFALFNKNNSQNICILLANCFTLQCPNETNGQNRKRD